MNLMNLIKILSSLSSLILGALSGWVASCVIWSNYSDVRFEEARSILLMQIDEALAGYVDDE